MHVHTGANTQLRMRTHAHTDFSTQGACWLIVRTTEPSNPLFTRHTMTLRDWVSRLSVHKSRRWVGERESALRPCDHVTTVLLRHTAGSCRPYCNRASSVDLWDQPALFSLHFWLACTLMCSNVIIIFSFTRFHGGTLLLCTCLTAEINSSDILLGDILKSACCCAFIHMQPIKGHVCFCVVPTGLPFVDLPKTLETLQMAWNNADRISKAKSRWHYTDPPPSSLVTSPSCRWLQDGRSVYHCLHGHTTGYMSHLLSVTSVCLCCPPLCASQQAGEVMLTVLSLPGSTVWDSLSLSHRTVSTFEAFKSGIKTHLFVKYPAESRVLSTHSFILYLCTFSFSYVFRCLCLLGGWLLVRLQRTWLVSTRANAFINNNINIEKLEKNVSEII